MIKRGQIYWVQLDPTIGSEIKKTRPALVVSNDASNQFSATVTVLPITSNISNVHPFEVMLRTGFGGLKTNGKVKANQIRTIDKQRFAGKPMGNPIGNEAMGQVEKAIKIHLAMS